jgi:hypothetical protein
LAAEEWQQLHLEVAHLAALGAEVQPQNRFINLWELNEDKWVSWRGHGIYDGVSMGMNRFNRFINT